MDSQCTSDKLILFAIFVPKIFNRWKLDKVLTNIILHSFFYTWCNKCHGEPETPLLVYYTNLAYHYHYHYYQYYYYTLLSFNWPFYSEFFLMHVRLQSQSKLLTKLTMTNKKYTQTLAVKPSPTRTFCIFKSPCMTGCGRMECRYSIPQTTP